MKTLQTEAKGLQRSGNTVQTRNMAIIILRLLFRGLGTRFLTFDAQSMSPPQY